MAAHRPLDESTKELEQFFVDRPAISKRAINSECYLPGGKLTQVLLGHQRLRPFEWERLYKLLKKYGWGTDASASRLEE